MHANSSQNDRFRVILTDLGPFFIVESALGSVTTSWTRPLGAREDDAIQPKPAAQLGRYFGGEAVRFDSFKMPKGTDFQSRVRRACLSIPSGETISYADLAQLAGAKRTAARAVGQVMRSNPLPVLIPCHRVVGADGSLHGYAGSRDVAGEQLNRKRRLLELERSSAQAAHS